ELTIFLINLLGGTGNETAYAFLEPYLASDDLEIRAAAVVACLHTNYRQSFSWLISLFSSKDEEKIKGILNALSLLDISSQKEEMLDFLKKQADLFIKNTAIYARFLKVLLNHQDKYAVSAIIRLVKEGRIRKLDPYLQELRKFSHNDLYTLFELVLKTPDFQVNRELRNTMLSVIRTKEDAQKYLGFLGNRNNIINNLVVRLIISFGLLDKKTDGILLDLIKKEKDPEFFADLFVALCSKNTDNNEKFITLSKFYTKLPTDLKIKVIINFRKLQDDHFASNILYYLYSKEPDNKPRATVASIMGITATKESVGFFAEMLKDEDARVRANAVESFEMVADDSEEVIETLLPLLQDFNNRVKANVAITLWQHGGLRMLNVLEKMLLENPDKWHRASAAYAMGIIGNIRAIPSLTKALKNDRDSDVIANCVRALGNIGDPETINTITEFTVSGDDKTREFAFEALTRFPDNKFSANFLFENMNSHDPELSDLSYNALLSYQGLSLEILEKYTLKAFTTGKNLDRIIPIIANNAPVSFIDLLKKLSRKFPDRKAVLDKLSEKIRKKELKNV
ncbi:MAG: HEAT repeat domain-containing protein, partial [Candidatus Muiribacteriaceae bacterium]